MDSKLSKMRATQLGVNISQIYVGNCKYSDITVFSFHPVKIITTGEEELRQLTIKNLVKKWKI